MSNCHNRMCGVWSKDRTGKELCCMGCMDKMSLHDSQSYSMKVLDQLTRIADSLEKVTNPIMTLNSPKVRCMNCGELSEDENPHQTEWPYMEFCSHGCIMELGEKLSALSNKQPCQNCCNTAGENIIKEKGGNEWEVPNGFKTKKEKGE